MQRATNTYYIKQRFLPGESAIRQIAPKIRVVKNLTMMGIGFLLVTGSYAPLRTYFAVSSETGALGPLAFSILYAVGALSCLYGSYVARRLKFKLAMVLCLFPYLLIIAAVAYTQHFIVFPSVLILGAVQGPLWCASAAYMANIAAQYSYFSYDTQRKMIVRFLSAFNAFLACGYMIGHLVTGSNFIALEKLALNGTADEGIDDSLVHMQSNPNELRTYILATCGRWFCNGPERQCVPGLGFANFSWEYDVASLSKIVPVYTLSIFVGNMAVGPIIIFTLLDKLTVQLCAQTNKPFTAGKLLTAVMHTLGDRRVQFILPMLAFLGIGEAFLCCDMIKAFVQCFTRESVTGYVLFCYGCVSCLFHASLATVLQHIGRLTVALAGLMCLLSSLVVMWMWRPAHDDQPILFVIVSSWAMGDSIFKMLCQTMIFKFFPDKWEAPISVYFMFTSFGTAMGFAICPFGCMVYKIYFMAAMMFLALGPFLWLERRLQKEDETALVD